jgi:hypothetical protein
MMPLTWVNISKKSITTMEFLVISDSPDEKMLKNHIEFPLLLTMDGLIYGIKNKTKIDLSDSPSSPDSANSEPTIKKEVSDHSDYHHQHTMYRSTILYSPLVEHTPFVNEAKKGKLSRKPKPIHLSCAKCVKQEPK